MGVFFRQNSKQSGQQGFTLVEVCIGLIIISMLAIPYMQMYQRYQLKTINEETANNMGAVKSALAKYATRYGRYPLPANPSLAAGSAADGVEVAVGTVGTCTVASINVCRATTPTWGVAGHKTVLIGTVPYATLGLPIKNSYDGYKSRFKYAITEFMTTTPYTFNNDDGIIMVVDKNGNDTDTLATPVWSQCAVENGTCSFT
ncbi:MAG: prepilin-type N-terminal cleavage/methylation domain protein, partial [Devosia sp.]|uniref:type II secretion system protein n=1 Tax=Devosia sp. TaxID=1871048 RepID=UPI00261A6592